MKGISSEIAPGTTEGLGLRDTLRQCELRVSNLKGVGAGALDVLRWMDRIAENLESLRAGGMDVRSEETRFEALESLLRSKGKVLVREMRSTGGLAGARAREDTLPAEQRWWWYLDVLEKERLQARVRRTTITVVVGAAVLAIGAFAFNRLFPPDPVVVAKMEHTQTAERYLEEGDIESAVAEYEAANKVDPSDGEVLVALGLLYQRQGREEQSEEALREAERLLGDRVTFLVTRGVWYARFGDGEAALSDAKAAVELDPENPEAHFTLARAYELLGDQRNAIAELDATARLAEAAGNSSLYVIAKTNQAMLMQQLPVDILPGATPTE